MNLGKMLENSGCGKQHDHLKLQWAIEFISICKDKAICMLSHFDFVIPTNAIST